MYGCQKERLPFVDMKTQCNGTEWLARVVKQLRTQVVTKYVCKKKKSQDNEIWEGLRHVMYVLTFCEIITTQIMQHLRKEINERIAM